MLELSKLEKEISSEDLQFVKTRYFHIPLLAYHLNFDFLHLWHTLPIHMFRYYKNLSLPIRELVQIVVSII